MKSPTEEEFEESIKELSEYKNRLEKEVVTISQKLKMPQRKIESIINSHQELNKIKIFKGCCWNRRAAKGRNDFRNFWRSKKCNRYRRWSC